MRHIDILHALQNLTLRTPKQKEIAEALNVKISVIGNRSSRNSNYSLEDLVKLSQYFGVNLVEYSQYEVDIDINSTAVICDRKESFTIEEIRESTKNKSITINYWNDLESIKNPLYSELLIDAQKINNHYHTNPENLCIVAMLGDEMDGGQFPIKNNDILVIDTSINDTSTTGIYFCSNHSSIFIRRIVELVGEGIYISVDNPLYQDILNRKMTYRELDEVGFKVIGKVIGNETIRL